MANKKVRHSFNGMNQDLTKSKYPAQFYYKGRNIRIVATDSQSTGSVTNEKGNVLKLVVPIPTINLIDSTIGYTVNATPKTLPFTTTEIDGSYGTSGKQIIIGHGILRDCIILFTTDNSGFDCVWKVDDTTYDVTLLYMRNLGFSINNPIQVVCNYENDIIEKVYWVDGKAQMRFINIHHSVENQDLEELIDLSFNAIQVVGNFEMTQPVIDGVILGGNHTSGMIQYAYNLYKINGSQSKISPLTDLISLDKGVGAGGGEVNEIVGETPIVRITGIDDNYTNLRLYAIKYTSYNQLPQVSLILDRNVTDVDEVVYYDDGAIIQTVSIEEFLFLGSDLIIPQHINTKKGYMFFANYEEKNFDIDIDTRAYAFPESATETDIYNSTVADPITEVISSNEPEITVTSDTLDGTGNEIPKDFSAINIDYNTNAYQYSSAEVGGSGQFINYKIKRKPFIDLTSDEATNRFLKDNEIYRAGIQFYNTYGQVSLPKWIADFRNVVIGTESNLNGYYATFEIELKPSFYSWLADDTNFEDENGIYDSSLKPIGYRLLRAERNLQDRTIICQGLMNGMMSQLIGDSTGPDEDDEAPLDAKKQSIADGIMIPSMMRRFDNYLCPMFGNKTYRRVDKDFPHPMWSPTLWPDFVLSPINDDSVREVFQSADSRSMGTYQYNKMMQLFSPELTFNITQNLAQARLHVIGALENDMNGNWCKSFNPDSREKMAEWKFTNVIYPWDVNSTTPGNNEAIFGGANRLYEHGFFARGFDATEDAHDMMMSQTYRKYSGTFTQSLVPEDNVYEIYGTATLITKGQGRTVYNNDAQYTLYNTLEILTADEGFLGDNSWGTINATIVLGEDADDFDDRPSLEDLFIETGVGTYVDNQADVTNTGGYGLVGELRIPEYLVYVGHIYGGNGYESKKRSNYLEIGLYNDIATDVYECINYGDTYIGDFKFTKLVKTDTELYSHSYTQTTEIVEFRVETTVNIFNRNDQSLTDYDTRWQPRYDEYQRYNKVYSQEPGFILRRDLDYKFKRVSSYDTNVISSKIKTAGEVIDSWTDLRPNNILTLDGKYGPINTLISFKDNLYTLQDLGVAYLSILPRVQVDGSDGIGLALGTGKVLDEYKYVTTESGTKNKWSVVVSPNSIFYYDSLNKSINGVREGVTGISDAKGMHTYLINNTISTTLEADNPILNTGVIGGYDYINNDLLLTFLQGSSSFTIAYNEMAQQFTSFYDYKPSRYISKGDILLTTSPDHSELWKQYEGEYNKFYGTYYPSSITLLVAPESDQDTILDNIMYKSEVYLNDVDQPLETLTHTRVYNEYQDSTLTPLIVGRDKNLRRKFRDWNMELPRQLDSRQRVRNPWNFVDLQFTNIDNYKLILHEPVINYSI
jgi:hypothetical protein